MEKIPIRNSKQTTMKLTPEEIKAIEDRAEKDLKGFEYHTSLEDFAKKAYVKGATPYAEQCEGLAAALKSISQNSTDNYAETIAMEAIKKYNQTMNKKL